MTTTTTTQPAATSATPANLGSEVMEHCRACFTGLWIQTHEHEDATAEIRDAARQRAEQTQSEDGRTPENWILATWDIDRGLRINGEAANAEGPVAAIKAGAEQIADDADSCILILRNFHHFIGNAGVQEALRNVLTEGKTLRVFVVVLSPVVRIPVELEKLFVVIEHKLPDRATLQAIAENIATEPGDLPEDDDARQRIYEAAAGLTRLEAENAYALSLIRHGSITPTEIWSLKSGLLKKSGLLSLHRGRESFSDLGGMENAKRFCSATIRSRGARGVMLLGVPGAGKSAFAKALGNATERPTLALNVGSLMGGLVGESENNMRRALEIADAMAPCVLFVDEIEKALAGAGGGGKNDGGVADRMFGTLLSWLQDHTTDVYFIGTCNDIEQLTNTSAGALIRAERFDAIFFVDLPTEEQREKIWPIYLDVYGIEPQPRPDARDWTGAEIKSCCRLAKLEGVSLVEAAQNVIPIVRTAGDKIQALRQFATDRCLSTETRGVYQPARNANRTAGARAIARN